MRPLRTRGRNPTSFGEYAAVTPDIITAISIINLRPGEERKDSVHIDRLFELNAPGIYTVLARRVVSFGQEVVSPKFTFEVARKLLRPRCKE